MKCFERRFLLWPITCAVLAALSGCVQLDRFSQSNKVVPFQPPSALSSLDQAFDQRRFNESRIDLPEQKRGRLRTLFDSQASNTRTASESLELRTQKTQFRTLPPVFPVRSSGFEHVSRSIVWQLPEIAD